VLSIACAFPNTQTDELKIWAPNGEPLGAATLPEHATSVAIISAGGTTLIVGASGTLWELPLGAAYWALTASSISGRTLSDNEVRLYRIDTWRARERRDPGDGAVP
jgi:hypothetical protein